MFKKFYYKLISSYIWLNEDIFFFPKLKKAYLNIFSKEEKLIIFDVGANRGQTIDFFKKIYPKSFFYSFEPNKKLYHFLQKKYKENKNITLLNMGVSENDGELLFNECVFDETSTFETINKDSDYLKFKSKVLLTNVDEVMLAPYKVAVRSLDSFCKEKNIDTIDIAKIDVEGHELSVLKGMLYLLENVKVKVLQLEEHFDDQYENQTNDIKMLLAKFGYKEFVRIKHGFGSFYEVLYKK